MLSVCVCLHACVCVRASAWVNFFHSVKSKLLQLSPPNFEFSMLMLHCSLRPGTVYCGRRSSHRVATCWHRATLRHYAGLIGRCGRPIQKQGLVAPLRNDFSYFFLMAEYWMDSSQIWFRHPSLNPRLSLLVSRSQDKVTWALFSIFCLFILFFTKEYVIVEKLTKANIA